MVATLPLLYKREDEPPLSGDVRFQRREVAVFEEERDCALWETIVCDKDYFRRGVNGWEVIGTKN